MTGFTALRETWMTQWGPAPVLALCGGEERKAPITLPGGGIGRASQVPRRADPRVQRFA